MKPLNKIDTTTNYFNDKQFLDIFQKAFQESFMEFAAKLDIISARHSRNLHWWVSLTASRNITKSSLYREFCIIKAIQKMHHLESQSFAYIISSHYVKEAIIFSMGNDHPELIVQQKSIFSYQKFKQFIRPKYYFFNKLLHIFLIRIKFSKPISSNPLNLAETFISPNQDLNRYYPNFHKFLKPLLQNKILFVPTIINTSSFQIFKLLDKISISNNKYFFRESFLNIFDLLNAINYRKELNKINIQPGFDSQDQEVIALEILVSGSLKTEPFNSMSAEGILNFQFIKKLKLHYSFNINTFIDWWENTPMDKGLNMSLKLFYPQLKSSGYMGFIPNQLSFELSPTNQESMSKVLPDNIGVIGEAFLPILRRCNPFIDGFVAPAFRFAYLENFVVRSKKHFLVLPSIDRNEWRELQKIIFSIADEFADFKFIIKPHPGMGAFKKIKGLPNIEIENFADVKELIKDAEILITSASSAAMEAIALSIPTFIYQSRDPIPKNVIPSSVDQSFWKNFSTKDDLSHRIKELHDESYNQNNPKNVIKLSKYFNLPNEKDVLSFFFSKYE